MADKNWTISDLLDRGRKFTELDFLTACGGVRLTYGQAGELVEETVSCLYRNGLLRRQLVFLLSNNTVDTVVAAFGVAQAQSVFCVLPPGIKPERLGQVISYFRPAIIIAQPDQAAKVQASASTIGEPSVLTPDLVVMRLDVNPRHLPEEVAMLQLTSGTTTCSPKGVVVRHENIRFAMHAIQARLKYERNDCIGLFLPLGFDYGLYQVLLAANVGASVFVGRPEDIGPGFEVKLRDSKATVLPGVPTLFDCLLSLMARRPASECLPLRVFTNTGEHLPSSTVDQLLARFPDSRLYLMYGLTECKRVSILLPEEREGRPDSVGRALDGTDARVVDREGKAVSPGTVGELEVMGPHVTGGYLDDRAETQKRFRKDPLTGRTVLCTGDYCRMDRDGYIYFVSRDVFLIKHRGYRISAMEIEDVAYRTAGVQVACAVYDNERKQIVLYVVAEDGYTRRLLIGNMQESLEPYKIPGCIVRLERLPQTRNGKIDRVALQNLPC